MLNQLSTNKRRAFYEVEGARIGGGQMPMAAPSHGTGQGSRNRVRESRTAGDYMARANRAATWAVTIYSRHDLRPSW
jgi:hypothetical protein